MDATFILGLLATGLSTGLAVFVLARDSRLVSHRWFAAGLLCLAADSFFASLSTRAPSPARMILWQQLRFLPLALAPGAWLLFSLTYSRGNYDEFLQRWRKVTRAMFVVPAGIAVLFWTTLIAGAYGEAGEPANLVLSFPAQLLHMILIVASVIIVANLEKTLRTSTGTMRWQIKFLILGLAVLFVSRVFVSSQAVLYGELNPALDLFAFASLLMADALILWSLFRARSFTVDLYPSHEFLYGSITVVLVGAYLVAVGVLAELVTRFGGTAAFPLKALLVLVALMGLAVVLLSNRLRQRAKRFLSRHLRRPQYDYRAVWSAFTDRTSSVTDLSEYCRKAAKTVSDTFEILSVTIWLIETGRGQLLFGGSTSITEQEARDLAGPAKEFEDLVAALRADPRPVDIDASTDAAAAELRRCNPEFFKRGGNRICLPLTAGGEPVGLMTLGDRVSGLPYSAEELDLLKTVGGQIAAHLLNIRLSARLLEAKEMQAFQAMSTFLVHDLKNTASALSLTLQNLPKHFEDPAFRQDALDAIAQSTQRINDMIRRLTVLRQKLEIHKGEGDMNDPVRAALGELDAARRARVQFQPAGPARASFDPEQMQKVLMNLVLNALEADEPDGVVRVSAELRDGWALCSVSDRGCGMSPDFVAKQLFRPFQTTKRNGMGIGMFHARMIVEAHQGRIEVESQEGVGSTFRVLIPAGRSS